MNDKTRKEIHLILDKAGVPRERKNGPLSAAARVLVLLTAFKQIVALAHQRKHEMLLISEVYERYKHLDTPLSDSLLQLSADGFLDRIVREMWAAVKQVAEANAAERPIVPSPEKAEESQT